jgi:hypothetical protein
MKDFYTCLSEKIQVELLNIDIERCDISIRVYVSLSL